MEKLKVITPDNLGKGIVYNSTTKQWEVAISQSNGNLLQLQNDGLYYGIEAPAETKYLYVDAESGVDQDPNVVRGAGTKKKPLRTIAYANSLATLGTVRTIYLKTEQEHVLETSNIVTVVSGLLNIAPYGDAYDQAIADNNRSLSKAKSALLESDKAPKIVFRGAEVYATQGNTRLAVDLQCMSIETGATVTFSGVTLHNDTEMTIAPVSGVTKWNAGTLNRIIVKSNANVDLTYVKLSQSGTVTVSGTTNWTKDSVTENDLCVFGFFNPSNGTFNFSRITLGDINCYVIGHQGWNLGLSNSVKYSIANAGLSDVTTFLAKAVYRPVIETQGTVKILLAPISDVSATKFTG